MDQVFGVRNFLTSIAWQGRAKNDRRFGGGGLDYMVVFGKSKDLLVDTGTKWMEPKPGAAEMIQLAKETFDQAIASDLSSDAAAAASSALRKWIAANRERLAGGLAQYSSVDTEGEVYRGGPIDWPGGGGPRYEVLHPVTQKPVPVPKRGWGAKEETLWAWHREGQIVWGADESRSPQRKLRLSEKSLIVPTPSFVADRDTASKALEACFGDKRFPFPKNHEVLMRWFRMVAPSDGVILDFFAGSGSTAEAVMRLNAEDGGTRQAILVTNNELAAADAKRLRKQGYQPGDPEWEARGVFQHVTKPRLETVATGIRAAETADPGSRYSDGLAATVDFYDLDYLESDRVRLDLAFRQVAPLLWLKAGGRGDVITDRPEKGYAVTAHYGVLHDVDQWRQFALELPPTATHAFIVTDTPVAYQTAAAALPDSVEKLRLYENYLHTFEINTAPSEGLELHDGP